MKATAAHRTGATCARVRGWVCTGTLAPAWIGFRAPGFLRREGRAKVSRLRIAFLFCAVAALLIAAGCGDDDDSGDTTTAAAENCTPEDLQTISDGKLTVATDSPAF